MAQLTVRKLDEEIVAALRRRAAANGRSAEAEHREILRKALLEDQSTASFLEASRRLRARLKTTVDSTAVIRADRDRDTLK
jgi:plasmid stability protein